MLLVLAAAGAAAAALPAARDASDTSQAVALEVTEYAAKAMVQLAASRAAVMTGGGDREFQPLSDPGYR